MSTTKIGKVRSFDKDIEIINLVALKLCGKLNRVITNKDVINALLQHANGNGNLEPDKIINSIKNKLE